MANVYSQELLTVSFQPVGYYFSELVPDGFVWDVRCVDLFLFTGGDPKPKSVNGCSVFVVSGGNLLEVIPALQGYPYQWEGRRILGAGDGIGAQLLDDNWSVSVMGYQLTLP